ncbi:LAMI_0H07492g1_1 [Lachancea mirantina]|uniref:LAMI_0H07492g1_1 n=1 Tax=Lachancea mirantina TaxID=1230905 RepID=A0A1G4KFU6_9SACH|nr:LAMI_0H07492g1_1 [Lachancea mirantina]
MGVREALEFAEESIPLIIPLQKDEVRQLCEEILANSGENPDLIAGKLIDILGHEESSLIFALQFNEKLNEGDESVESAKSTRPRQAETLVKPVKFVKPQRTATSVKSGVNAKTEPFKQDLVPLSDKASKEARKDVPVRKLMPGLKGISDTTKPVKTSKKPSKTKKLRNIREIDDVLENLEVDIAERDAASYVCYCQGNRHPLFEVCPNCTSCGKIICVREGLHLANCSFCGKELIPGAEREMIIQALKHEKDELNNPDKTLEQAAKPTKFKTYKITSGGGRNLFSDQDKLFKKIEQEAQKNMEIQKEQEEKEQAQQKEQRLKSRADTSDPELAAAEERLHNLLHFQDTSAERTKIIDTASDFSMDNNVGVWGSAYDQALLLKKQQRNLRKWEKAERAREGHRNGIRVDISVDRNGKVHMVEIPAEDSKGRAMSDDDADQISDEDDAADLKEIKDIKGKLSSDQKREQTKLQSKIWDYKTDKYQFQKPVYVGHADAEDKNLETQTKNKNEHSRIQMEKGNDTSLEQNILAVL